MAEPPAWWQKPRNVTVCADTEGWFDDHATRLVEWINEAGDQCRFVRDAAEVQVGGIAFYLSCMKLTPPDVLARNRQNIVVHASALPKGRGFSPIVWQILEGEDRIPLTMILAADEPDSGDILMQDELLLEGSELNGEIRDRIGRKIVDMCLDYLSASEPAEGRPQQGKSSWYRRRKPEDSRLDPDRTIAEQFDLLRAVDNDHYPAFFDYRGRRYILRIEAAEDE
jgi:methionyl-tRNA formyltransferase